MWTPKKYTTLPVGTIVRLATGEVGEVEDNQRADEYGVRLEDREAITYFPYWAIRSVIVEVDGGE